MANNVRAGLVGVVPYLFAIIAWVIGFGGATWYAWHNAPIIGGEYWPYIRVAVAVIAGFISAHVMSVLGAIIGALLAVVVGFIATIIYE